MKCSNCLFFILFIIWLEFRSSIWHKGLSKQYIDKILAFFWPPTRLRLKYLKEFHYCHQGNFTYHWHFPFLIQQHFLSTCFLNAPNLKLVTKPSGSQHIFDSIEANEGALFSVWSNVWLAVWPHDSVQIIRETNSNQSRETYH